MYNQLINAFIDAQTAAWRQYSAAAALEKRLLGESAAPAVRVPTTDEITTELRRVYWTLMTRMVRRASVQFARDGVRLSVNKGNMAELANFDIERSLARGEVPDFDSLWRVMELQLGNIGAAPGASE
jgi:hypothetical protein